MVLALAAVLLVRPALSIADVYDHLGGAVGRLAVTAGAYVVWIATMVARREPDPIRTLALAGATYGLAVIVAAPILWIFLGAPDIPPPGYVFGPFAVIATNALFGAVAGAIARLISSGRRSPR